MAKKTLLDNIIESIKGIDGQLIKQSGTTKQMISDLNYKVVAPAKSAADSAVSAADAAVASAQVTSDAVTAIASATAEAKQGANEAMSRAESAWDVATGAKEAVTDFDPLLKSAQSDASKALTQIAETASALSDAKTAFSSDVAEAKQLANTAQTTADSAVESASENAKALASQANALSDAKKAMDSGVASATGLANAAQTTADNAIKSASSVANDLAAVASQAKANASGITKVTSDVGLLQTTVADNSGNISKVQETAAQLQQAVSDNAGNITTAKQTADSAVAVASDAKSNATVAVQTASGASVTAKNAQSDATTAMVTAKGAVIQASDAKSNATIAVQTASEASVTATNAQGDASVAKQTASDASVQIKNAQGDISKLQTRAGTIEASVATNSGAIADVQATANQLKASVSDNAGNITVAKQTADSAVTVASDASSNATVAIQTASQASITANNASGQAASAVLTANGAMTTASNAKSDATVAIQTASGASLTATNAQSDATIAKQTASEATVQASNAESDFAQLSIRANKIEANVATNSGAIASVQQTANGLTTTVASLNARDGINLLQGTSATDNEGPLDFSGIAVTSGDNYTFSGVMSSPSTSGVIAPYIQFYDSSGTKIKEFNKNSNVPVASGTKFVITATAPANTVTARVLLAQSNSSITLNYRLLKFEHGSQATPWTPAPTDARVAYNSLKVTVDQTSNIINDPKTGLNATYQTAAGNSTTISNVKSDVAQLETTATGLTTTVAKLNARDGINLLQGTSATENEGPSDFSGIVVTAGDSYTFSGFMSSTSTSGIIAPYIQFYDGSGTKLKEFAKNSNVPVASGTSFVVTGVAPTNSVTARVLLAQSTGSITINYRSLKFEHGSQATPWTPAPTDASVAYNSLKVTVDQTSDIINDPKTGLNATYQTAAGNATTISNVKSDVAQLETTATGLTSRVGNLESKTNTQETAIEQNKAAIALKADQTDVNTLKGTVSQNTATLKTQADLISSKVTSSDVTGMLTSYATQTYTQSLVTQKADEWNLNLTKLQGDTQTSLTNLSTTVDGIKSTVATKADQSTVTELSNALLSKVESSTYTSAISQLSNDINLRVKSADLISQINLQAGTALIQSNKLVLDAETTVFTGNAFIPSAAISELDADKLTFYGADNTYATIGASVAQYDDDKTKSTINLQYSGGIEIHSSDQQGSILTMHDNTIRLASKSWGDNSNPYQYSGFYAAPNYSLMNTYHRDGTTSGVAIDDNQIHIYGSSKDNQLGALKADVGWYSINGKTGSLTGDQISLKAGNTQAVLTDNNININNASDTNSNNYDVGIHIKGWAEMTGWFTCMGLTQTSLLSTKTRIEPLDTKVALDKIVSANVNTYQFKTDVAKGKTKRHASVIIDDVHDVAEYCTPEEFISEDRKGRDDGDIIGYLMGAVQELAKRIKTLEDNLNE